MKLCLLISILCLSLNSFATGKFTGFQFQSCSPAVCVKLVTKDADTSLDPSFIAFDNSVTEVTVNSSNQSHQFHATTGHLDLKANLLVLKGISELGGHEITINLNPTKKDS